MYELSRRLFYEACESWDCVVSDKLVYFFNPGQIALDALAGIPEDYMKNNNWVELHFILHAQRESHYAVIIDCDHISGYRRRELEIDGTSVSGNSPMFVDITKFVESPQQMGVNIVGIPSVKRLKRVDNCGINILDAHKASGLSSMA